MAKTKTQPEKKYIVLCNDAELWVVGTKEDVLLDFTEDKQIYIDNADNIKIYELGESIPFTFVQPQLNF